MILWDKNDRLPGKTPLLSREYLSPISHNPDHASDLARLWVQLSEHHLLCSDNMSPIIQLCNNETVMGIADSEAGLLLLSRRHSFSTQETAQSEECALHKLQILIEHLSSKKNMSQEQYSQILDEIGLVHHKKQNLR